jgi:hypothetical protein
MNAFDRVKRNHGLEHATISIIMSHQKVNGLFAGYSTHQGFLIVGQVDSDVVSECLDTALQRLKDGESELAVSTYCGTNIMVSAVLAVLSTALTIKLSGSGMRGIGRAVTNTIIALIAARPIGRFVQARYTTSPNIHQIEIRSIAHHHLGKLDVHWISTMFA